MQPLPKDKKRLFPAEDTLAELNVRQILKKVDMGDSCIDFDWESEGELSESKTLLSEISKR